MVLIFRGADNQVRSLYWMFGAVGHDNLTGSINAPKTASNPAGWFSTHDGFHHVTYRTSDGHLHELWWQGQGGVGHGDLTAQAGAVSAAGDPWPYYDPVRATNIVAFRGSDRHIRSLYWGSGAVGQDDLSGIAGTPAAAGDPFAWYTPVEDTHRVVYRAANNHLYELSWPNVAPVSGRDLTALARRAARRRQCLGRLQRRGQHPARHLPFERRPLARTLALPGRDRRPSRGPDRGLRRARRRRPARLLRHARARRTSTSRIAGRTGISTNCSGDGATPVSRLRRAFALRWELAMSHRLSVGECK